VGVGVCVCVSVCVCGCVCVCNLETKTVSRPRPDLGCCEKENACNLDCLNACKFVKPHKQTKR